MLVIPIQMQINPQFLLIIVTDTRIAHIVQPVECPRNNTTDHLIVELVVYVLGLFEELADVGAGAHTAGKAGGGVADQC